jgi:hypothetical protein
MFRSNSICYRVSNVNYNGILKSALLFPFPTGEELENNFSRHVKNWLSRWMPKDVYIFIVG